MTIQETEARQLRNIRDRDIRSIAAPPPGKAWSPMRDVTWATRLLAMQAWKPVAARPALVLAAAK